MHILLFPAVLNSVSRTANVCTIVVPLSLLSSSLRWHADRTPRTKNNGVMQAWQCGPDADKSPGSSLFLPVFSSQDLPRVFGSRVREITRLPLVLATFLAVHSGIVAPCFMLYPQLDTGRRCRSLVCLEQHCFRLGITFWPESEKYSGIQKWEKKENKFVWKKRSGLKMALNIQKCQKGESSFFDEGVKTNFGKKFVSFFFQKKSCWNCLSYPEVSGGIHGQIDGQTTGHTLQGNNMSRSLD